MGSLLCSGSAHSGVSGVASPVRNQSAGSGPPCLLVGLAKGTLAKTEAGFEQMNAALKARAEQATA
jgi:hypothetical protein